MNRGGVDSFYHMDGLGSIVDLTDNLGAIVQSYVYDSFGNIVLQNGSLINPYTYTGREFDEESGLYFYRARYYDPVVGRFLQEDPVNIGIVQVPDLLVIRTGIVPNIQGNIIFSLLQNPQSFNLYPYVLNNPVNFIDPSGETEVEAVFAVVIISIVLITAAGQVIRSTIRLFNVLKSSLQRILDSLGCP